MSEANYWKLGLFVISCVVLSFAALAFLGAKQFDRVIERIHFFFDEPVDGLSIGSQVRLRGIPIGNVNEITLAPDLLHVGVMAEIDVETLIRLGIRERGVEPDPFETRRGFETIGLRAYLETNPLTGLSVINLNMYEELRGKWPEYSFETPTLTVATVPSTLKGIMGSLEGTLKELQKAIPPATTSVLSLLGHLDQTLTDIEPGKLANDFQQTLVTLRQELEELQVSKLSAQGQSLAEELEKGLQEARSFIAELRREDGSVNTFLETYSELGVQLRQSLSAERLQRASDALVRALEAVAGAGHEVGSLSQDLHSELSSILEAVDSLRRLAIQLERDPGSLLHGKTVSPLPRPREGS